MVIGSQRLNKMFLADFIDLIIDYKWFLSLMFAILVIGSNIIDCLATLKQWNLLYSYIKVKNMYYSLVYILENK